MNTFRCRKCGHEETVLAIAAGHPCPKDRNKMVEFDLVSPAPAKMSGTPAPRKTRKGRR